MALIEQQRTAQIDALNSMGIISTPQMDELFERFLAALPASEQPQAAWSDGVPPHPFDKEWFIAKLDNGQKVVLKALPEEYSYDFRTADETYFKSFRIKCWMQFPESEYIPYVAPQTDYKAQRDSLLKALALIEPKLDFSGWENGQGEDIGSEINATIASVKGSA